MPYIFIRLSVPGQKTATDAAGRVDMRNEYDLIGDLARSGEDFVLCRVTNTAGSTPRSIGAIMAVRRDGSCIGSVGGGRPEYECAQKAGEMLEKTGEPCEQVLHFNLGDNEYVCGGSMDIEISLIRAGDDEAVRKVLEIADSHRRRRVIIFGGGHVARALVPGLAGIDFDVTVNILFVIPELCTDFT